MRVAIRQEPPNAAGARALIAELEAELEPHYPTKSQHGYSVAQLLRADVAFFVAYFDGEPAACGGIELFERAYGELKRMYVRPAFRGHGLGRRLVEHLIEYARERDVPVVRLETGIHQHAAIRLYEHMGFRRVTRFGDYPDDPLSVFFETSA